MGQVNFEIVDGHFVLESDGKRLLLDTGSPTTYGRQASFVLDGTRHDASTGREARQVLRHIDEHVGPGIDVLLGNDVLEQTPFTIEIAERRIVFGTLGGGSETALEISGVPKIATMINGHEIRAIIDTGAPVSYVLAEKVAGLPVHSRISDHNPSVPGAAVFESDLCKVEVACGAHLNELLVGAMTQREIVGLVHSLDAQAILGFAWLNQFTKVGFDLRRGAIALA
jgi:hypothetical protein